MKICDCQDKIYSVVKQIPKGKVTTYGTIARYLDLPSPRMVGSALHLNPDPANIPCHRVVNFEGKLARSFTFGGQDGQAFKLSKEGIEIRDQKVDLKKYLWESTKKF